MYDLIHRKAGDAKMIKHILMIKWFCALFLLITTQAFAGPEIFLMAHPAAVAYTFPASAVVDTFTGTNGTTPPNASWGNVNSTIVIQSNTAAGGTAGSLNNAYWTTTYTANHLEAYVQVTTLPADGQWFALELIDANTTGNGYEIRVDKVAGASNDTIKVFKVDAYTPGAQIGSTQTSEMAANDWYGMYINGSTIQIWKKLSAGSWTKLGTDITDSTYSVSNNILLDIYSTTTRLDNFGAGTP